MQRKREKERYKDIRKKTINKSAEGNDASIRYNRLFRFSIFSSFFNFLHFFHFYLTFELKLKETIRTNEQDDQEKIKDSCFEKKIVIL